ncbi:MAG TPA: serine/threonine-protein kinase [Streptosporangiaceae bacterium]|nr:serine/threonine-protein kinase [Streptosporangiaceae bacterium]
MVVQPALEPLRRWDPERIGPYVLLGRLGAGAMGQVFLGRSTAGRLVAVKTIKIEFAEEAGFRARFAHEVAAARRVSGVFTAAVVAADADADVPWLATAYVPAPSLTQLVRSGGPLPVLATRWLAAGCAEALESIHTAGLVHRDLKPSNVLVSPDGPRVIDFGVARAAERVQLTVTRGAVGTPAYMAPEQARDTRQASSASDVFSLGATLLYAATGHAPYQGETVMDVLVRLATEPPDLDGLPGELTDLVTACLERSPRKRPTSVALLSQLGPFVSGPAAHNGHHAYLTDPAMALIGDYQHGPVLAAQAPAGDWHGGGGPGGGGAAEDATFGSHTALSTPQASLIRRRWLRRRPATAPPGRASAALPGRPAAPRRQGAPGLLRKRRHGALLTLAGRTGAAAALVAVGALIAVALERGDGRPAPSSSLNPAALGLPPAGPPPSTFGPLSGRRPGIEMLQPQGDGITGFVVHGAGWPPRSTVTLTLAGRAVAPVRVVTDGAGVFNYTIDQAHVFYTGPIPAGRHEVVVTGDGRRLSAAFQVLQPPPPGAPSPVP